ncbi:MAG: hypothetical protein O3B73_04830 [bacterium]|jgi:hypothetical protein|nr:hypothetical protein [bacterium]
MSSSRSTSIFLGLIAILLLANLLRPAIEPTTAFAEDRVTAESVALTGTGANAWILKGNKVYYIKFEQQYESIRIYGPEELER